MRILVAGAAGAIGQPLLDCLMHQGHEVYGITQSEKKRTILENKGAEAIVLNVLDQSDVFTTVAKIRPTVLIDMLTHLPKEYTPESMRAAAEMDARLRLEGGSHLQVAAEMHGVERYIAQSTGFYYAPGEGLADETCLLAVNGSPGVSSGSKVYLELEKRVLQSEKIKGTALRFGFFYGPGTWFNPDGNMAKQVRLQQFPLIGKGEGIWNFVHIEDAAQATAAAIHANPGIYNVINDHPSAMHEWLPAFARFVDASPPLHISEEEALKSRGADSVYYATQLRGATNAKAKRELHFQPRPFEWLQ